ncbi:ABC transporter related protein [Bacillus sp. OxB-1]|uniref:ABC transporter ATP-binding protein n=1 Tax=Bacillus sp. (strain OxB-1) TaxID=98228 RepID=UPI000581BFA3|nr:sn-glycerol-3-phosphate ABC transporter ATP-binding protein UgpC [Bacillus sp. OxB-1]BAQ10661.1 ABC transporter related protein [Bacillus sp. OxB-1]
MSKIQLNHVRKRYSKSEEYSVKDFHLDIEEKEFIVLVGPSGCGKSTTLRMIAGLEEITDGDLFMDGKRVNDWEPKDRDIAMVFQNYALYPHMSVFENMAFGLRIQKVPKGEVTKKVENAAQILGLTELLKRKPNELSGGQRQRVALGRAIVRNSSIFLMDEPLSNLDAKLRGQMRTEIIRLHRQLGTTTIYVTHDQTEAMTMATRIVIMKDGVIQQIGTPSHVYRAPENMFVASFIGLPGMNFLEGEIREQRFFIGSSDQASYHFSENQQVLVKQNGNRPLLVGIRPESISIHPEETPFKGTVEVIEVNGAEMLVHTRLGNQQIVIKCPADDAVHVGDEIHMKFLEEAVHLFDRETEKRLRMES